MPQATKFTFLRLQIEEFLGKGRTRELGQKHHVSLESRSLPEPTPSLETLGIHQNLCLARTHALVHVWVLLPRVATLPTITIQRPKRIPEFLGPESSQANTIAWSNIDKHKFPHIYCLILLVLVEGKI